MKENNSDKYELDSLFVEAAKLVVDNQNGSVSFLQRKLRLGFNRAHLIICQLETNGIVGPTQAVKPRDVLIKSYTDLQTHLSLLNT